jgi:hypothetical protein
MLRMSTAPHPTARSLLVWMQGHHARLRELMAEEAAHGGDLSPAGEPAIRAQLRFVAEALAANAGPGQASELEAFSAHLVERMDEAAESMDEVFEHLEDATAFEVESQFGDTISGDAAMVGMLERRLRVDISLQAFLEALDRARPDRAPIRQPTLIWWKANARRLAHTIFTVDRAAKQAEIDRGGADAIANPEVVNQIGQAAMLQGHIKFLIEALAQNL